MLFIFVINFNFKIRSRQKNMHLCSKRTALGTEVIAVFTPYLGLHASKVSLKSMIKIEQS